MRLDDQAFALKAAQCLTDRRVRDFELAHQTVHRDAGPGRYLEGHPVVESRPVTVVRQPPLPLDRHKPPLESRPVLAAASALRFFLPWQEDTTTKYDLL